MKPSIRILLIVAGTLGVVVTTVYDFFRPGPAEFGRTQFMGFVISVLLLMAGFRSAFQEKRRQLDTITLWVYLLGMLYLVLVPESSSHGPHRRLLEITAFLPVDFGINILGFFPLGYLLLSILDPDKGRRFSRYLMVILSSIALSLLIEILQYYIPGRTSSLNDLVANGMGGGAGVLYYHFEGKIFGVRRKSPAQ